MLELEEGDEDVLTTSDRSVWVRVKQEKRDGELSDAMTRNNEKKVTGEVDKCFNCNSELHYENRCTVEKSSEDGRNTKEGEVHEGESDNPEVFCMILNATVQMSWMKWHY